MAATAAAVATRPYQIVVWGASGFTGKLVCEHIARDYQGRIRWAMAGRDQKKLELVRKELETINPAVGDVPILVADAFDKVAVGRVVSQAQVVLAMAGPFALHGDNVVAQAVEQGTHYCDITGEVPWVKRSAVAHHAAAEAKGVKVVHCSGYDSIPSDLGVLMLAHFCMEKLSKKLDKVYTLALPGRAGVSGGTIASAMNILASESRAELMEVGRNTYYLADTLPNNTHGTDRPARWSPTWVPEEGVWAGPFLMEGVNAKIVHYSNKLRPQGPYGKDFKYQELAHGGPGLKGWFTAWASGVLLGLIGVGFSVPPLRALLKKVLPAPGQGPSLNTQRTGFWRHKVVAVTEEEGGKAPTVVRGLVGDDRDCGYWSTSRMILETGLALAQDADAIAQQGSCRAGGVLTPATAVGMVLIERLRAAGFIFKIDGDAPTQANGAASKVQAAVAASQQ